MISRDRVEGEEPLPFESITTRRGAGIESKSGISEEAGEQGRLRSNRETR